MGGSVGNVFSSIGDSISSAFNAINDNVIKPISDVTSTALKPVETLGQDISKTTTDAFGTIGDEISRGATNLLQPLEKPFQALTPPKPPGTTDTSGVGVVGTASGNDTYDNKRRKALDTKRLGATALQIPLVGNTAGTTVSSGIQI